jgi:protein dithiol oxidoreductase (disulfide-forming)
MKKLLSVFSLLVVAPLIAFAQGGISFTELKPAQPVAEGKKIDVVEFFWYGCIHCYNLEPVLEPWVKKLPADVQFRRVPAVFNARWERDAAIFYTFESMGLLEKLHRPFFDAIHRDALRSDSDEALGQWLQKQGVDTKKFFETLKSFSVQSKTRRAVQLTSLYRVEGTPMMAVQGKYTVSADQGRSREGMLATVSQLVDRVRKGQ